VSENNGFIKKIRSTKSKELKRKHLSAYLILDTLAENAKRDNTGHPLLELGEGIITAEECGLSSQQFETGIKYLSTNDYVEIIHRGRKDKDSKLLLRVHPESTQSSILINTRINGTVLKLIDSSIYDINIKTNPNHIPNQTRINSEFTPNKQEIKKEEIKEEQYISREALNEKVVGFDFPGSISKEIAQEKRIIETPKSKEKNSKVKIASEEYKASLIERCVNIHTSEEEHKKLIQKEGIENTEKIYNHLSEWKKSISLTNPKMAESHSDFYRINKWVIKAYHEENSKKPSIPSSIEENKKYALSKLQDYESKTYRIDILSKAIEFTPNSGQSLPKVVNFSENGFKEQVDNTLITLKFERKK
jgi:hypothetical protein